MVRKLLFAFGLVICVALGWVFGYIRFPYVPQGHTFWFGFAAALGIAAVIIVISYLWKSGKEGNLYMTQLAENKKGYNIYIKALFFLVMGSLSSI